MTKSEIHDTIRGIQPGIMRTPANVMFEDLVELFWIQAGTGEEMTGWFPRNTANEFLSKHLKPQVLSGLLNDAGIRELPNLGTN